MNKELCYSLFYNIIDNAVKYDSQNIIKLEIRSLVQGDYYQFSIQDNGIGIEEEYLEYIFEMFKRLHNDLDKKGSGIGLAICKRIVTAYSGKIWVESKINEGSTFYFTLPVA